MTLKSWSLFHGRLSFALNTKILHPMEVIAAAVDAWKRDPQQAAVNQSLYWDFYARHRAKLESNPRIGMMYRTWDRMAAAERRQILRQAAVYCDDLENL